ncbi:hypothetical protein EXIGLDRAFT_832535 [Exidia glandulosa HHB12029]|uniref:F-box domain-containing protein n=1 Tax=Exidia glandulosa HHB12029 TaxID=1314781 RepID=A0A165LJ75_EXIGL|nr:hypothetical protein EXIGLDRAFT_832535 [Exidia glandulosa HHB12029]
MADMRISTGPERHDRGTESHSTTTQATKSKRDRKRRRVSQTNSSMLPASGLASSLPDEILLNIFTHGRWFPDELAFAARVCRRWAPASTQVLYSDLELIVCLYGYRVIEAPPNTPMPVRPMDLHERANSVAQTMRNSPYLCALVRELYVEIYVHSPTVDLDVDSLLGWTALIPDPGLRVLVMKTNSDAAATILLRAPALRNVRGLYLRVETVGHTISAALAAEIIAVPHRIEHLELSGVEVTHLPPALPHLRTLRLLLFDPARICEILEGVQVPALHTLCLVPSTSESHTDCFQRLTRYIGRCSAVVLRVNHELALELTLSDLGAVEELYVDVDDAYIDKSLVRALVSGCGGRVRVMRLDGYSAPDMQRHSFTTHRGVRVEYVSYSYPASCPVSQSHSHTDSDSTSTSDSDSD